MTAATIPKIRAADEPVRTGASFDGAEVEEDEGVRVAEEWWLVVLLAESNVKALFEVKDAVLKVEFRDIAVPVPDALAMLVMLAVELLNPVGTAVPELVALLLSEPPLTVKSPE